MAASGAFDVGADDDSSDDGEYEDADDVFKYDVVAAEESHPTCPFVPEDPKSYGKEVNAAEPPHYVNQSMDYVNRDAIPSSGIRVVPPPPPDGTDTRDRLESTYAFARDAHVPQQQAARASAAASSFLAQAVAGSAGSSGLQPKDAPPTVVTMRAGGEATPKRPPTQYVPMVRSAAAPTAAVPPATQPASRGANISLDRIEQEAWFVGKVNVTDLWSRVQHSPHETFAVLKTGDNKKYVVMISNEGWPVIFSVINLGQGRVRAAEDGTEYPSLAQVIRAMRVGGVSVEGGARIRPRFPLPTSWFHRSAAWEICVMKRVQPRDLLQHSWYWDGPKERGDTAVSAGRPGDFIVRPSSDGTKFVVACKPFGEGSANLVRLQIKVVDQSTYTFGEKSAPTLSEIIQIMRSYTLPNPAKGQPKSSQIKLRQPVKGAVLHRSAFRAIIKE